jgi:hypothetical protein
VNDATDGLLCGDWVPNFTLPVADGRALLFYEFAVGKPMLVAASPAAWSDDDASRFDAVVAGISADKELQSVHVTAAAGESPGTSESTHAWVSDPDEALRHRLFGELIDGEDGVLVVTDANLRVLDGCIVAQSALHADDAVSEISELVDEVIGEHVAELPLLGQAAPVLIVPRVLPVELCEELISRFDDWEPEASPMPAANGADLNVDPERKSRRDVLIGDADLEQEVIATIARRVLPEVAKSFHYQATHFERLKLVSYTAESKGHFATHRDSTSPATAHRRFALTINLNAEDYDGGDLVFPEYGDARYRPETGGAIVFSGNHAHAVTPVTRGDRYAIVSFMFGDDVVGADGEG